jgi:hypothetical protein
MGEGVVRMQVCEEQGDVEYSLMAAAGIDPPNQPSFGCGVGGSVGLDRVD